jgi:hypothetical protein
MRSRLEPSLGCTGSPSSSRNVGSMVVRAGIFQAGYQGLQQAAKLRVVHEAVT